MPGMVSRLCALALLIGAAGAGAVTAPNTTATTTTTQLPDPVIASDAPWILKEIDSWAATFASYVPRIPPGTEWGKLPDLPEPPLPAIAGPKVPLLGTSEPYLATQTGVGVLVLVIVLNWVLACGAYASSAAAPATDEETQAISAPQGSGYGTNPPAGDDSTGAAEETGTGGAMFACVECIAGIASIILLTYVVTTGVISAWLGGQKLSGWILTGAILSVLQLLACVIVCCCSPCTVALLGEENNEKYVNQHSRHIFGSHMHGVVHTHKPEGTHPIHEGHLPVIGHPLGHKGKDGTVINPDPPAR